MPVIKILPHQEHCPEGKTFQAPSGTSLCEALLEHDIQALVVIGGAITFVNPEPLAPFADVVAAGEALPP